MTDVPGALQDSCKSLSVEFAPNIEVFYTVLLPRSASNRLAQWPSTRLLSAVPTSGRAPTAPRFHSPKGAFSHKIKEERMCHANGTCWLEEGLHTPAAGNHRHHSNSGVPGAVHICMERHLWHTCHLACCQGLFVYRTASVNVVQHGVILSWPPHATASPATYLFCCHSSHQPFLSTV
jgi:hypothetical protein